MLKQINRLLFVTTLCGVLGPVRVQAAGANVSIPALSSTNAGAQLGSSGRFVINADTPWVVAADEPEAVQRALADVQADWYKVLGHPPIVLNEPPPVSAGPVVYLGTRGPWLKELVQSASSGPESFVLRVQRDAVGRPALVATGADVRGAIYAAYALAEEILGVDPWYYWVDKEPAFRGRIEIAGDFSRQFGPPTFKYRGWFINDEDLLSGFAPDPLRENVFSLEMLDRICETILRLRGNMIVPGTFNYPDERCWEVAARRGLALNMHHILVVGLNTYRWPKDVPFSHTKHPAIMERYWRDCIAAYKGREVVWAVGYRGKYDRPFWADEPEIDTPKARGAVITRAIARQVELIREVDPHGTIIANLWSEGADMMHAGHLKLPAGVVVVWADDGAGIIRDDGTVQAGQGVYYHTAMCCNSKNQLSEMVNPGRIYGELGRFVRAGATNFFLVNVSDVRPVLLSTDCAMRFAWNAAPYLDKPDTANMDAFLVEWSGRQFGTPLAGEIAALYDRYFDIPYHRHDLRQGDSRLHYMLRALDNVPARLIATNQPISRRVLAEARAMQEFARTNRAYVAELAAAAEKLKPRVPVERRDFFQAHVLTAIHVHLHSLEMLESYSAALIAYGREREKAMALAHAEEALRAIERLFTALRAAETGKWSGWFLGETLIRLDYSRDRLRGLTASLRGDPPPPIRPVLGYQKIYEYQERFQSNFPRLYPHSQSTGP